MSRFAVVQLVFVLSCGMAASKQSSCKQSSCASGDDDTLNLMQVNLSASKQRGSKSGKGDQDGQTAATCSDLKNQGAYFTIDVGIGTPPQIFNLVADTGSDALIIPDCRCVDHGYCSSISTCFAPEDSSSFALDEETDSDGKPLVLGAKMDYGSGEIQVLIGSDHADLQGIQAGLHNGVFLMEDRRSLDVHGDFEGILGLGLPHNHALTKDAVKIPSFMEQATTVKSYSLCFNEWPHPGALRTSQYPLQNPMGNVGSVHWGLGIEGFSAGGATTPVFLCDPASKPVSQKTPCGAIPDSGTTLLMGPADHIHKVYASLCRTWPRCSESVTSAQSDKEVSHAFHQKLRDCESWMTQDQGVSEIPSLFIHFVGSEGNKQTLELSAWSYVVETTEDIYNMVSKSLYGSSVLKLESTAATKAKANSTVDTGKGKAKAKRICTASFGPQDYNTPDNGPVWIMGSPIFYATKVGYSVNPPQISFQEGACASCSASLLSTDGVAEGASARQHALRSLQGEIRRPGIDVTKPL